MTKLRVGTTNSPWKDTASSPRTEMGSFGETESALGSFTSVPISDRWEEFGIGSYDGMTGPGGWIVIGPGLVLN